MRGRILTLALVAVLLVAAIAIFASPASAGTVTRINYLQNNTVYYHWTAPSNGKLTITIGWTVAGISGAPTFPVAEVDAMMTTGTPSDPYVDSDVKALYGGSNPMTATVNVSSGNTYYIGVMPYIGDTTWTLDLSFGGNHVTALNNAGGSVTMPQSGTGSAADGELYIPSTGAGNWISCIQWWPGTSLEYYANWNDYVYERVSGATYDTLSENYVTTFLPPQPAARATLVTSGSGPKVNKWYSVAPQIWPSAKVPNHVVGTMPEPGDVAATKAPAWYTYSYTDSAVATNKVGYFLNNVNNASASKRNVTLFGGPTESCTYKFYGTTLTLVYTKGPAAGIASIKIDNNDGIFVEKAPSGGLDMYSAGPLWKQTYTVNGLTNGWHNVVVKSMNPTKNPLSTGWFVYVDGFTVDAVSQNPINRSENNYDGQIGYQWTTIGNAKADGASMSLNGGFSAAAAFSFTGTAVSYVYEMGSAAGKADVYIDGQFMGTVNEYSALPVWKAQTDYTGLSDTTHTLLLLNNKSKDPASTSYFIYIDAFIVGGTHYQN